MDTSTRERDEHAIALASPSDVISDIVGSPVYSARHRFADLRMTMFGTGRMASDGLAVSRFYFGVQPMVAVDIIEHQERFKAEIAAKRAYCAEHGIRYALVAEPFDDDGVRQQLTPIRRTTNRPRTAPAKRPRTRKAR